LDSKTGEPCYILKWDYPGDIVRIPVMHPIYPEFPIQKTISCPVNKAEFEILDFKFTPMRVPGQNVLYRVILLSPSQLDKLDKIPAEYLPNILHRIL
jgi:hypothetical protein